MTAKILLIEASDDLRENTAAILKLANYEVHTSKNGREGIEIALNIKPDLVISDIPMTKIDGYGVLQILRKNEDLQMTPFIFMSAKTKHSDVRKGMDLGASDYITIPFKNSELLSAIESRLNIVKNYKVIPSNQHKINEKIELENLEKFFNNKEKFNYKNGASIYCEGNSSNFVYYLINGKVKTFKNNEYGKEFITSIFKNKSLFGFTSLIKNRPYIENAVTLENSTLLKITKSEFLNIIKRNDRLAISIIDLLVIKLDHLKSQLIHLAYDSVRKKTAETLYELYLEGGSDIIEISRSNLASLVGIAKETLIRTLTELKEENIIKTNRKAVKIINHKKLKYIK